MKNFRLFLMFFIAMLLSSGISAQQISDINDRIKKDVEGKDYASAAQTLRSLQNSDGKIFKLNNYDYLLARLSEKTGDYATAAANYQAAIKRNSVLSEYALWHLSALMRAQGNLPIERLYLKQLLAIAPDSLLNEAAQMRLAESFFESRDFTGAIQVLQKAKLVVSNSTQPSVLPSITANTTFGNLTGNDPRTRDALVLLGRAHAQNGQAAQAREIFDRLCNNLPNPAMPDDFALAGTRGLDELDKAAQNAPSVPKLAEAEHMRRAGIYQFNRDFASARLHYKAVIENHRQSGSVPDAMYQTGRGYVQEVLLEEAIPWFERLQSEFPAHPLAADALNQAASIYARIKKTNEAIARYQKYIATYPESDGFERAYLNIIDVWRDEAEFTKALEWTEKTQERFAGKTTAALALFARAKIHMSQNDWNGALRSLEELQKQGDLGGTRVPGGTNKTEVVFLHALSLEKLARFSEAANEYLSIPDGRNEYYGWRATEHLKALGKDPSSASVISARLNEYRTLANQAATQNQHDAARKAAQTALRLTSDPAVVSELIKIIRRASAALPAYSNVPTGQMLPFGRKDVLKNKDQRTGEENQHQILADELLFLSLYDEGAPELEMALRRKNPGAGAVKPLPANSPMINPLSDFPPDTAYTLGVIYQRGDRPHRATSYIEPLWKKVPDDYSTEIAPRESIEMLYPAPYAGPLLAEAAPRGLDPRFVLSIMRQESRFRPDVKSSAAARGLMQFISSTAETVAKELGKTDFNQDELYHPPTAVMFGSQYLKDLFGIFPEKPQAVAASYNGGEINMARWLKRTHSSDPDLYVPEIVFSQSKDYVYRVMANYRLYCQLYDDKLKSLGTVQ